MSEDSDAFAELFAATADRQLYYLAQLYGSREAALEKLGKSYTDAMRQLSSLGDPGSFMAWISRLSANTRMESAGDEDGANGPYSLTQILNLPLTEAQVMLMSSVQQLSDQEICGILNMSRSSLRRFVRSAQGRLGGTAEKPAGTVKKSVKTAPLTPAETSEILDGIFETCGRPHNTTAVEDLSSYAVYRKERFTAQRTVLAAGLVIFMLLPLCFVLPQLNVEESGSGTRGLPVYDVSVRALLPVGRVLATIRDIELPVYEVSGREYTVEPTGNGLMTVTVQLINRQKVSKQVTVDAVDSEAPRLVDNVSDKDTITLRAADDGIGVDYHGIYAVTASGTQMLPLSADEEGGIVFPYPEEDWDIYIPDHLGNTLHLSLRLDRK